MRILLATAVAIAPLLAASGAMAEVVISTGRTTPITTLNATGSGPDSIRIDGNGSITLTSGVAVTVNSSHNFEMDSNSRISMTASADGSTGVLVHGGNTADITLGGIINVLDDITTETDLDADDDGDNDGQFARGTGRYGVRVIGTDPLVGNILLKAASTIVVSGNNSYGISLEAPLTGDFMTIGTVTIRGDGSYGVRTTGTVSGDIRLIGAIGSQGAGAIGASIEGDVAGALLVQSTLTTTGFRYTTRPPETPVGLPDTAANRARLYLEDLDADDLLVGGPALRIASNIAGGVLLGRGVAYSAAGIEGDDDNNGIKNGDEDDDGDGIPNRTDPDRDGNGVPDVSEGTATITSFGSGAGVLIGSETQDVTLGAVGTGDSAFGFINRGSVSALGVFDGFSANGVVFGTDAGHAVNIAGGIRNEGTIVGLAFEADSTAVRLRAGTTTPTLINAGTITAASSSSTVASEVAAVRIDVGASLPSFTNSGSILATAGGGLANTTAILDLSGTLTSITNLRSLQATSNSNAAGDPVTGVSTAINVSANTTGVTILQNGVASAATSSDPDTDGDGVTDGNEPIIVGDIRLGSGADTVDIRNGLVLGDIYFGAGADLLSITGGAEVRGGIYDSDGALSINVANGVLQARHTTQSDISDLTVGANGSLIVTLDGQNGTAGGFNVSGNASFADGAGLGVRFVSLLAAPTRFTLIDAGTLNYGAIDLSATEGNSPYLYVVQVGANVPAGQVYADVRQRTVQEAGLIASEAAMFNSFYSALGDSTPLRDAFLAQVGRADFISLYEQMLPDHGGGPLMSLSSGVDAVTRALTGRNASAAPGETSAWIQEINFYADKDKTDTYGFRSEGFGVAGGIERGTDLGALGLSVAFTSSDLEDPEAEAEEVLSASLLELGLYWRAQGQYWTTWARAAAGYATFESKRRFVGAGLNMTNESDWSGFTLAAAGGVSYERNFGRFSVRPEAYAEFFSLSEDGHVESGGGDGFDLEIDDRDGHVFSATAAVNIGMSMGENSWLRPELRVGWRQNISVDPGETIARFRSGGPDFTLDGGSIKGGGPIIGLRLNVGNELGMLSISADAEMIEDYVRYMLFLRASFRF